MTLTLKRTVHVNKDVEIGFPVAELAEKFTDDQLRSVGLYRDLGDADIARLQVLDSELAARAAACDDEDCGCASHQMHGTTIRRITRKQDPDSEPAFWSAIRTFAKRRDTAALLREFEKRAWIVGGVTVDLSNLLGKG